MTDTIFSLSADALPATLAIMPLRRVVLLPGGRLPLNMFETRYTAMVRDALSWPRLIGIIQPLGMKDDDECESPSGAHPLYAVGCAGRIVAMEEADGHRFQITLQGVCRFRIAAEEPLPPAGYRIIKPDWQPYIADLHDTPEAAIPERKKLLALLKQYFILHDLNADWNTLAVVPTSQLLTSLVMACPFGIAEKQALLEAPTTPERAAILTGLIEMELLEKERSAATLN